LPDVSHHLHPLAEAEIAEHKAMLARSHRAGLISAPVASRQLADFMARVISQATVENQSTRMLRVVCRDCKTEHLVPSDVVDYRCHCSPNIDRKTYVDQTTTGESVDPLTFTMLRERPTNPFQ